MTLSTARAAYKRACVRYEDALANGEPVAAVLRADRECVKAFAEYRAAIVAPVRTYTLDLDRRFIP